jgi:arylsulfatase
MNIKMTDKPNILFICADQFRGDTLECSGHPDIKTPNIDALAKDGTNFINAYTPDPICVPARATMITGKYPHKCTARKANGGKIIDGIDKMPELFAKNGYKTYSSGKLHYVPYAAPGKERLLHGFEKAVLAESGRILAMFDPENKLHGVEDYVDYLEGQGWKGYTRAHGIGNNDIHPGTSPLPQEHNVDAWVATKAIDYINEHIEEHEDQPFLLHASFPKPHAPYDPPRPFDSMYDPRDIQKPFHAVENQPRALHMENESATHGFNFLSPEAVQVCRAHYYGLISFQDAQIGKLIQTLKDKKLYDNTIIIFTADHGDMMGDFGYFFKTCMYEGSARVPFIIAWPEAAAKGQLSKSLVGLQDILPTIAEMCGIELNNEVDGISLCNELKGETFTKREEIISYSLESPTQTYMIRNDRYKYIYNEANGFEELYDLKLDPGETNNLYGNCGLVQIETELKAKMLSWIHDNDDKDILDKNGELKISDYVPSKEFSAGVMGWRWY